MKAFVLSGGSIKGAFQAGAIKAVIENKMYPEFLYGISVGSLNATFINHEAGKQGVPFEQLNWQTIGNNLISFWKEKVKQPSDLITKRGFLGLAINILRGKFDGVSDTRPLRELVKKTVSLANLQKSPLKQKVGTVNFINGDITYAIPDFPDFLDWVIASTAIPVAMPAMLISKTPYFDGGLRDIAPLKPAIKSGADTVVAILCQPEILGTTTFSHQNAIQLLERITDIMCSEIEKNDIETFKLVNTMVPADGSVATSGPFTGKRKLKLIVIRPEAEINVDISSFTSGDIQKMLDLGYQTAMDQLKKQDEILV
jgi:NTE family protein